MAESYPYRMAARLDEATSAKLRRMAQRHNVKGGISDVVRLLVANAPEDLEVAQTTRNRDAKSVEAQRVAVAN